MLAVIGCLLALLLSAPSATAGPQTAASFSAVAAVAVAQPNQPGQPDRPGGPGGGSGVQPGPNIEQQEQQADRDLAQNKTIVGAVAALLLVVVFFGRRSRNKYRRKVKNLQNAKS